MKFIFFYVPRFEPEKHYLMKMYVFLTVSCLGQDVKGLKGDDVLLPCVKLSNVLLVKRNSVLKYKGSNISFIQVLQH